MTLRVLLVDDTDHVRETLVDIMELHGFEVVGAAGSGAEALDLADHHEADVAILDYRMPGMDGLETARRLRGRHPEVGLILYSAYVTEDLQDAAEEVGVAACVPKLDGIESLEREISALGLGGLGQPTA